MAAVLVDAGANAPNILLIKRAKRADDPWSGQMAFPGGRRESDDVDRVATACRETLEETGIGLRATDLLGELDDICPLGPGLPRIVVRPFVFLLRSMPQVVTNEEVELFLWVKLSDLPELAGSATVSVSGVAVTVPAYNIEPHVVWGLTEHILKSFFELCL